jgi:hypothetical protein
MDVLLTPAPVVKRFPAPEGAAKFVARYCEGQPEGVCAEVLNWGGESVWHIAFRDSARGNLRILHRTWHFSEDGEHGCTVLAMAWSPDGRFLASQVTSSGGHQPYSAPVSILDLQTGVSTFAEDIIKRLPVASNIDVTWGGEGSLHWTEDGRLHVVVVDHDESGFDGGYLIDAVARKVNRQTLKKQKPAE